MVIIDAGHGGSDPGGGSNSYWIEKDLNLKISLYQYNRLKSLGVPVALTRDSDVTLNPDSRINKVKSLGGAGDILISNHINIDYGNLDGAEVIYSIRDDQRLARMIAESLRIEGQNLSSNGVYTRTNQYGNDYYYIIREIRPIKGVLIEYGFADSKGDDIAILRDRWFDLAEAVVRAICEYLGYKYVPILGFETYTVKKGDTLFNIASKFKMTLEELKGVNGLTSNTIYPGMILLVFPQTPTSTTTTYIVKKGDTLFNIAKSFGVSVETIKNANALTTNNIYPNQELIIPITYDFNTYTVKKGDTLYSIANKLNVSVDVIKTINNLKTNVIYPNQVLLVPSS